MKTRISVSLLALLVALAGSAHAYDRRTKTSTQTPTHTPTITRTWTVSPTQTPSRTATLTKTASLTPTISATATLTHTPTPTATPTPSFTTSPTPTLVASDNGLVNWDSPVLSRKGGRLQAGARINLGDVFLDKSAITVPFIAAAPIVEGQAVSVNSSGHVAPTSVLMSPYFVGIATNDMWYTGGRVYVAVEGVVRVQAPAITINAGERYFCNAAGAVTGTGAIADPSIYTSLSNTTYVMALEPKNLSGCTDCTFRGLLIRK